jgi:hypothetical protein
MKRDKTKDIPIGTIRIKTKGLEPVVKTKTSWKKTKYDTSNIKKIVHLFKAHANFNQLLDTKDKTFLKGHITPQQKIGGERIGILPNGRKLNKAYSILAPHLTIHDETNDTHWDAIFQNPNEQYSYLYTKEKQKKSSKEKYKKVKDFEKHLPKLKRNLNKAIKDGELIALPLYTLLKTHMRIGNEHSYQTNGHKGLTTLKKHNTNISKNKVRFKYIGKDGVPQTTINAYPNLYITKLQKNIGKLKKGDFIFTDKLGRPLKDTDFEKAFEKYCGQKFYPHIVRSHYATTTVENYLAKNKKPNKDQIKQLYSEIADKLGHKKFSKSSNQWETSYTVTIAHYIQPELIGKINRIILSTK